VKNENSFPWSREAYRMALRKGAVLNDDQAMVFVDEAVEDEVL
jgi:hypothetical protein